MRMKGFFLTIDSLLALTLLLAAAATLALGAQQASPARNYPVLEALGRDYLVLKYAWNATINETSFQTLTGFALNESGPDSSATLTLGSQLYAYPFPLAGCGCTGVECNLTVDVNTSCLGSQEGLSSILKQAWVKA